MPRELVARLDDAIYREKYRLLTTPHLREEIDYVVKPVARVEEQVRFDTFRHMVASKILQEATLLYGSGRLFSQIKEMVRRAGVPEKLGALERRALAFRREAERYLREMGSGTIRREYASLFYPAEESEEFE